MAGPASGSTTAAVPGCSPIRRRWRGCRVIYPESVRIRCGVFTAPVGWDSLIGMSGAILTAEDRAHLLRMMRRQTPSPVHRRVNALLLLDDGWAGERGSGGAGCWVWGGG